MFRLLNPIKIYLTIAVVVAILAAIAAFGFRMYKSGTDSEKTKQVLDDQKGAQDVYDEFQKTLGTTSTSTDTDQLLRDTDGFRDN